MSHITGFTRISGEPGVFARVRVRLAEYPDGGAVRYVATAPPHANASFSGSGMPYASADQAFYASPNRGEARVGAVDGEAELLLAARPAAYYGVGGTVRLPPAVALVYDVGGEPRAELLDLGAWVAPVPYRSLTHPYRRASPAFYAVAPRGARSQERILRDSAYGRPEDDADFWGDRPPEP
jgi:hypothetical protein